MEQELELIESNLMVRFVDLDEEIVEVEEAEPYNTLRLEVLKKIDGEWENICSYQTMIPVEISVVNARKSLEKTMEKIRGKSESIIKQIIQELSWNFTLEDFYNLS